MRLRLILRTPPGGAALPIDYQHDLQEAAYALLTAGSKPFAKFLYCQGFRRGKHAYKLFTYSWLIVPPTRRCIFDGELLIEEGTVEWEVGSPVEGFATCFRRGLERERRVQVGKVSFGLAGFDPVEPPLFRPKMRFSCLTPIVASTLERGPASASERTRVIRQPQYVEPGPEFTALLRANLAAKYELVYGDAAPEGNFTFEFDPHYVQRVGGRISKLKEFKGHPVRGYMAPFRVEGPPELIAVGYECGFGEKNSGGFGMVKPVEAAGRQ